MTQDLRSVLKAVGEVVRSEIEQVFQAVKEETKHDDPWSGRILDWLFAFSTRQGKSIRPTLVAIGAAAASGQDLESVLRDRNILRCMALTELMHKRLLMADDVADRDELRNDEPAYHLALEQWLETQPTYARLTPENRQHFARSYTEVSGIWLQQIVSQLLASLQKDVPTAQWQQMAQDFNRHSYQYTIAGWLTHFDQNLEPLDENVSRERFLRGLDYVTGHYSFISPLLLGTSFGTEQSKFRPICEEFGSQVGLLFQLSDDILGLYGDPAVTGKPVGGDVREGKKTLLVQETYSRLPPEEQQRLQAMVGNPDVGLEDIEWLRERVRTSGAWEAVQTTMAEYQARAQQALTRWPDPTTKLLLEQLIQAVAQRNK